jgi:hypothetical protein
MLRTALCSRAILWHFAVPNLHWIQSSSGLGTCTAFGRRPGIQSAPGGCVQDSDSTLQRPNLAFQKHVLVSVLASAGLFLSPRA